MKHQGETRAIGPVGRALGSPAVRELAAMVLVGVTCFVLASAFDLLGRFESNTSDHQRAHVGELVVAAVGVLLLAAGLSWRRLAQVQAGSRRLALTRLELAMAHERYRSLFDYHPNAVFSVDFDGRITSANRAAEEITGLSGPELLASSFVDLVAPSRIQEALAAFAKVLQREPQQVQSAIIDTSGRLVEVDVTALPMVVSDQVIGVYGIATDITARKQLERELMRAQLVAEQADGAKSLMIANVSHEVRAPLTSLLGHLELLQETDLDPVQARFADLMGSSGDRLLGLLDEIMDFSRLEAGTAVLAQVPFDPALVITDVAALVGPAADNKGLYFKCTVDPSLPEQLVGDPARIAQVLTILLDNAVKFTDHGWVRAVVTLIRRERGRALIRFDVSDSGIGMPTRQRDQLFQGFSRADVSMTRRHGGTGLGLTRCHQVVSLMGGSISVDSTPGLGSAFSFTVSFGEAPAPGPRRFDATAGRPAASRSARRSVE